MKAFVHTITVILLFASCCTSTAKSFDKKIPSMGDSVGSDYTANATAIERKKQEMLALQTLLVASGSQTIQSSSRRILTHIG